MRVITTILFLVFATCLKAQEYHEIIGNGDLDNPSAIRVYLDEQGFDLRLFGTYKAKDVTTLLQGAKKITTEPRGETLRILPLPGVSLADAYAELKDLILNRYGYKRLAKQEL